MNSFCFYPVLCFARAEVQGNNYNSHDRATSTKIPLVKSLLSVLQHGNHFGDTVFEEVMRLNDTIREDTNPFRLVSMRRGHLASGECMCSLARSWCQEPELGLESGTPM